MSDTDRREKSTYDCDFSKNSASLKRCRKIYTITFLIYAVFSFTYVFASAYFILFFVYPIHVLIVEGIIFKAGYFALAFFGSYCRNNKLAVCAPPVIFLSCIFNDAGQEMIHFGLNDLYLPISIGVAVVTVLNNKEYLRLEQQPGFPYFNERFEKQKFDKTQFEIKSPVELAADERKKTESDNMDDISEIMQSRINDLNSDPDENNDSGQMNDI